MPNAMLLIHPYKVSETWVFDDEHFGLVQEPFVLGASEMIDAILATLKPPIENAERGFRLLFSASPFPGCHAELVRLREEIGGNWYQFADGSMEGWLCPALFHYFPQAPDRIYAKAEQKN